MTLSFFFNDTATTEIYTLSLHDALPICEECGIENRDLGSPNAPQVPCRRHPPQRLRVVQRSERRELTDGDDDLGVDSRRADEPRAAVDDAVCDGLRSRPESLGERPQHGGRIEVVARVLLAAEPQRRPRGARLVEPEFDGSTAAVYGQECHEAIVSSRAPARSGS